MRTITFLLRDTPLAPLAEPAAEMLRSAGHVVRMSPPSAPLETLPAATDILVAPGHMRLAAETCDRWPGLTAVISPVTGVEGFDIAGFTERGIVVANGHAEENSISTAEATILLLLAGWYDLAGTTGRMASGAATPFPPRARMLAGRTVGVIGHGEIGRRVVQRLAAFGVDILVHSRSTPQGLPAGARESDLDTLIAAADIICVCASLNASTHHMLNAGRLAAMKPDVLLVNSSRGGLIDEAALASQLAGRRDMRAALDVFAVEPLPADSPLRNLPNVLLTPHSVSHTRESVAALADLLRANIQAVLAGQMPPSPVNPEVAPQWRGRAGRNLRD